MAYQPAAADIISNGSGTDLSRDVYIETLEAFNRTLVALPLVRRQTISSGNAGQFIIGGKTSDSTQPDTYDRGTQVDVTEVEFDERTIILARPVYEAKRVDQFEEKVAHYDVRTIITNNMGEALANKVDRMVFDQIFAASSGTGLASNPDAATLLAITYTGTAVAKGNVLADAIFDAAALIRTNDVMDDLYVAVSPTEYSAIVRSDRAVNADFTNGNGGFDTGKVMQVGGVTLVQSNNVKGTAGGTGGATEKLLGLVFSSEAVGVLELIGMTTNQEKQIEFLDSTLMTAYYANGMGVLRPECAVSIMSA